MRVLMKFCLIPCLISCNVALADTLEWTPLNVTPVDEVPVMEQTPAQSSISQQVFFKTGLSLFGEYSNYRTKLSDGVTAKLKGGAIGISNSPYGHGLWGKFEAQRDSTLDADYYELSAGGQLNVVNYNNAYVIGTAGLGYAWADSSQLNNKVEFVSLPVGLEAGWAVVPNVSLFAGAGYKWLVDTTSSAACKDGATTNSTSSGACSWHNGLSRSNDAVGDNNGVTYRAGLRFNISK